jgi:hypothetical protein
LYRILGWQGAGHQGQKLGTQDSKYPVNFNSLNNRVMELAAATLA